MGTIDGFLLAPATARWWLCSDEKSVYIAYTPAGVALATFDKTTEQYAGRNVVVLICGGNIDTETLTAIL